LVFVEFTVSTFAIGADTNPVNEAPVVLATEESTDTVVLDPTVATVTPTPPPRTLAPGNAAVGAEVKIGTFAKPTPASEMAFVVNEATVTAAVELKPIVAVVELKVIGPVALSTFSLVKSPVD
jgi:hypothetical protein